MKWFYDIIEKEGEIHIFDSVDPTTAIASIYGLPLDDEDKRRARLIAAAPELLVALNEALFHLQGYIMQYGHGPSMNKKLQAYKELIAKATGEKEAVS